MRTLVLLGLVVPPMALCLMPLIPVAIVSNMVNKAVPERRRGEVFTMNPRTGHIKTIARPPVGEAAGIAKRLAYGGR